MPTNATSSPISWCTVSNAGISLMHGGHHAAQKFTTTGLPLRSARLIEPPSSSANVVSGAALPLASPPMRSSVADSSSLPSKRRLTSGLGSFGLSFTAPKTAPAPTAAPSATTAPMVPRSTGGQRRTAKTYRGHVSRRPSCDGGAGSRGSRGGGGGAEGGGWRGGPGGGPHTASPRFAADWLCALDGRHHDDLDPVDDD